ncbi:hypothetical protein [Roseomonas fluvialis]|uniref:Uncharacterized protein n=1 Tax=Roseomonas fluvialis TaxID=1750527 RepID=A0ABN6P040_9PROT|nr:hypothetical protein [Roseomonas fluvialis]BDG71088.1 hypothetical protein Rmf_10170 [Roseomonas fluvialis]
MPIYIPIGDIKGRPEASDAALVAGSVGDAAGRPSGPTILVRNHELNAQAADDSGILRDDAAAASVDLPDVLVTSYQVSGHGGGSESSTGELSHADALMGATPESGMAEGPPGTGKTLSAALLGHGATTGEADDARLAVDAADPAAGISHATTVLAWARIDGTSATAGGDDQRGTIEVDSFSWDAAPPGEAAAAAGWREYRVSVDTIEAVAGDDVIVDGRIITGENPASAAMADVEWKYVTVRPPSALEDLPAALLGPFDDLSDLATAGVEAGGPYSTGYVKVSDNAV